LNKPLTAIQVAKLKPGASMRRVKDATTPGLALVVHPSGARVWQFRARDANGKPRKIVLGPHDATGCEIDGEPIIGQPLTLAAARALAARLWRERARGADVFVRPQRTATGVTFGVVAREFVEKHARRETRRWKETAALLGFRFDRDDNATVMKGSLADRWRSRPLSSIDGDAIHQAIEEATEDGVPGRRARTKGPSTARGRGLGRALSAMFTWALKKKRYLKSNPCSGVYIPSPGEPRDRSLSDSEIRALWPAFDAAGEAAGRVLKLLLLTGCRLREISEMRRDEIVVDERGDWTLHLPKERTKSRRPQKVPFSTTARALVEGAPRIAGSPFVLTLDGRVPVSIGTKVKAKVDEMARIAPWRNHDLRRTVETHLAEMGVDGDLRDAILGHAKPGMRRVYDRSERLAERRAALERWAARVDEIVSGRRADNVVVMRGGQA
jgi:integrase